MSLFDYWDTNRTSIKRRKLATEVPLPLTKTQRDLAAVPKESPSDESISLETEDSVPPASADEGPLNENDDCAIPGSQTELESALPPVEADTKAIEVYELSQKSGDDEERELSSQERMRDGKWWKGKSSIYVDAFNLALDTVLAEEAHVFSEAEKEVFQHWRELSYESQYLYVPEILAMLLLEFKGKSVTDWPDMSASFCARPLRGIESINWPTTRILLMCRKL
jgi:Fanconi-associated nuclease 1